MGGDWYPHALPLPPISIQPITQGQTNELFILKLKHSSVILRLFSDIWTEEEIVTQNIVYAILSERGIAPKLHGVLPRSQGRLEQFYQCRTIHNLELYQERVLTQTTRILADIHRQEMPVPKDASFVFSCMRRWLKQTEGVCLSDARRQEVLSGMLSERRWGEELDWLEQHLRQLNYPIVFCHNDFSQANLLLLTDREEFDIKCIDFEFSRYNYRGADIAQHFKESAFDYEVTQPPFYSYSEAAYPSHQVRCKFVRMYLDALHPTVSHSVTEVESVVEEIESCMILTEMLGYVWALSMVQSTRANFGYLEFAQTRLTMYQAEKNKLLK